MKGYVKVGEIATLFSTFRASGHTSRSFTQLQLKFQTDIEDVASAYNGFWKSDFIQEGNLGLYNAALKYPLDADHSQFYFYALKAIRLKMLDFFRTTIGRSMTEVTGFDSEGRSTTWKESVFQETERYDAHENVTYSILDIVPSPVDYVASTELAIDIKYCLSGKNLKKNNFSAREIKIFDLHYKKGYNVSEVAKLIHLSLSQTSKIIHKTCDKVQLLLAS